MSARRSRRATLMRCASSWPYSSPSSRSLQCRYAHTALRTFPFSIHALMHPAVFISPCVLHRPLQHKSDIRRDPEFRAQFHRMCANIGVDPLASNKVRVCMPMCVCMSKAVPCLYAK